MKGVYTYKEKKLFHNKDHFPSQLRKCIVGPSGCGKSKLLFKLLLENYLDFHKIIFCSPSLSQIEYQIIIKGLQNGLNVNQIRTLFNVQKDISDIDSALDMICKALDAKTNNDKFKPINIDVEVYNHPDMLPLPQEINPGGKSKVLCVIDDCTIINSLNPTQLFVYGRPLNIHTI